ncbi:peroxisomal membrane protein PEX13-like [Watersipora subatra]|uniref:peroxisomal membrane protein PEX13-like n=1 Tax=Watersipora subatra TaxID=2589382 RepID=UPI00355B20E7
MSSTAPTKPWETTHNGGAMHNHAQSPIVGESSLNSVVGGVVPSVPNAEIQGAGRPPLPPRPEAPSGFTGSPFGAGPGYGSGYSGMGGYPGIGGYSSYGSAMYPTSYMGGGYGTAYSPYNAVTGHNNVGANAEGAFQSVASVVSAVSSISMMLESTYMALYNSFRAVLGVADQFSRLKLQLMEVASSFAVLRFIRWMYRRVLVLLRLRQAGLSEDAWAKAVAKSASEANERFPGQNKSSWPFIAFIGLTIFLIKHILNSISGSSNQTDEGWINGMTNHVVGECKYDFLATHEDELPVKQGQRINLAPADLQPRLRENDWLVASDGEKSGIVPASYIRILGTRQGKPKAQLSTTSDTLSIPNIDSSDKLES